MMKSFRHCLVIGAVASLAACATVPRDTAVELAKTGEAAATTLQTNLARSSNEAMLSEQFLAFSTTYDLCTATVDRCKPYQPSPDRLADRKAYQGHVARRIKAVASLRTAYQSFAKLAETDLRGDTEAKIGGMVGSLNRYVMPLGLSPLDLTAVVGPLAQQVGGIFADDRQAKQVRAANDALSAATRKMADALEREAFIYDSLGRDYADRRRDFNVRLLRAGLIEDSEVIKPLAEASGATLPDDLEARIKAKPALGKATEAVASLGTPGEDGSGKAVYAASANALRELANSHDRFAKLKSSDLDRLLIFIKEVDQAVTTLNGDTDNATEENGEASDAGE